jgi:hypothetical protein
MTLEPFADSAPIFIPWARLRRGSLRVRLVSEWVESWKVACTWATPPIPRYA